AEAQALGPGDEAQHREAVGAVGAVPGGRPGGVDEPEAFVEAQRTGGEARLLGGPGDGEPFHGTRVRARPGSKVKWSRPAGRGLVPPRGASRRGAPAGRRGVRPSGWPGPTARPARPGAARAGPGSGPGALRAPR